VLEIQDPPAKKTTARISLAVLYADALAVIQGRPNVWHAFLDYGDERSSAAISARGSLTKRTTGYEFQTRKGRLYARYIGVNGQGS
jgi:hypothetical protein